MKVVIGSQNRIILLYDLQCFYCLHVYKADLSKMTCYIDGNSFELQLQSSLLYSGQFEGPVERKLVHSDHLNRPNTTLVFERVGAKENQIFP